MAGHADSTTTILFALGANTVIAVAKGVAAWATGSTSMVAEAVHPVADCGNQGLLLLGLHRSARPPDAEYPLGHGRAIYGEDIAATLGLSLALLAVGMAMVTGNPRYDAIGSLAIGVLLLVVAVTVGIEVKALLVGQSADIALEDELRLFLADREEMPRC